ncbi:MAG: diguanylate cyclase [Planctomycetota bacterium]|nr:diguanylate cyclase [Planctomycetota bacterium]
MTAVLRGQVVDGALRVILVGRTGLDAVLRLDHAIELIRVATMLDAIGELASAGENADPRPNVVVVASDASSGVAPGEHAGAWAQATTSELIEGLRAVDPRVRVVRVGPRGRDDLASGFDAEIPTGSGSSVLRDAIRTPRTPDAAGRRPAQPINPATPVPGVPHLEPKLSSRAAPSPASPGSKNPTPIGPVPVGPAPIGPALVGPASLVPGGSPIISTPSAANMPTGMSPAAMSPTGMSPAAMPPPSALPINPSPTGATSSNPATNPAPPLERRATAPSEPAPATSSIAQTIAGRELGSGEQGSGEQGSEELGGEELGPEAMGDEAMLRTLRRGGSIVATALKIISARLGVRVTLVDPEQAHTSDAAVARDGRVFGGLRAPGVPMARLTPHGDWLAAWLAFAAHYTELQDAAWTDALTGAYNRRYLEAFLTSAIASARADRRCVTVLLLDLDNFKQYNDRFGHAEGDMILREIVRMLRSVVRPTDRVCRIGGDEFVVVLDEPDGPRKPSSRHPGSAEIIAARFQEQIRARFPKLSSEAAGPLSVSGGLATYPWDGATPEALLARADELTLRSKREGKNAILIGEAMRE